MHCIRSLKEVDDMTTPRPKKPDAKHPVPPPPPADDTSVDERREGQSGPGAPGVPLTPERTDVRGDRDSA